ncbi:MAG: type II toxin-antitoxin system RelE/ParE family toxin [Pseudomonadota bacterium]
MSRLRYTPAAQADLDAIWTYTTERWGAAQAAVYVRALDAACREVAAGTRSATPIDDIRPGYQKARVRAHVVYLTRSAEGDTVVIRILHGRMDVDRHLPAD